MTLLLLCRFILLTGNKTHREQGHSIFCCAFIVTIQEVCAFTALTVRKHSAAKQKSHR